MAMMRLASSPVVMLRALLSESVTVSNSTRDYAPPSDGGGGAR